MAIKSNIRKFYISTSAAASYTWLEGEQSNSFSRSGETIDVSDKSGEWAKFIAGRLSATADVTVSLDNTSASKQHQLLSSFVAGSSVYCFIGQLGTGSTPAEGDFFEAIITAVNDTNDKDGVASRQISLQVTGAPTHYPGISD